MTPSDFDDDYFQEEDDGNYTNEGNFNDDDFAVWDRNVIFNEDGIAVDADGNPIDDKDSYRYKDDDFGDADDSDEFLDDDPED